MNTQTKQNEPKQRIVCTGGSGYLGSVLTPRLLDAGHEVVVIDLNEPSDVVTRRPSASRLTFVQRDIRHVTAADLQAGDTIVHLAALSNDATFAADADWGRSINVDATVQLAESARTANADRFIFASSCSVYGALGNVMVTEHSPVAGQSEYALAKAECELRLADVLGRHLPFVGLRFGTLFGHSPTMRWDLVVNRMTRCALTDSVIEVNGGGSQWRPLLHVGDAAAAIQRAAEVLLSVRPRKYNVVGENTSIRALGEFIASLLQVEMITTPDADDPRSYSADARLILNELGVSSGTTITDGVLELRQELIRTEDVLIDLRTSVVGQTVAGA